MRRYSNEECRKLWDEKYTFFWYNAPQIFQWSQSDYDNRARELYEAGITNVMTFSVTHFRWTYYKFKKEILEALRKLVIACHKYNIAVEEHHSCHLTYIPPDEEGLQRVKNYFAMHGSSFDDFPGILDEFKQHAVINGSDSALWVQIDGSTGRAAETGYLGHAFCFNNPDYRKAYFDYVRELAACGIDSLLADDVQYFGDGQACCCKYCRELFLKEYGYTLPEPEHWGEFYNHYERADFIAWRHFRFDSTRRFQLDLTELYRELGLDLYRANYRSTLLQRDPTANTFTNSLELWAQTFQENMWSAVIKYSWPIFYCEALVQHSVGERKNAPSMSLFYPTRRDQYYMAWALSQSWGQLPFLCPEGHNMIAEDKFFNEFEKTRRDLFRQVHKVADAGFVISRETMDYTLDAYKDTLNVLRCFIQGAYFDNLCVTVVSEDEDQSAFDRQKVLFLCGITRLLPELLQKLISFVKQGGRVYIVGKFATCLAPSAEAVKEFLAMKNVHILQDFDLSGQFQFGSTIPQMYDFNQTRPAEENHTEELKKSFGGKMRTLAGITPSVAAAPAGYLTTLYRAERQADTLLLHIFNSNGLLHEKGTELSHADIIENFVENAPRNRTQLQFKLNIKGIIKCTLHTPEKPVSQEIRVEYRNDQTVIDIPQDSFAGYAMLELITANQ